MSRGGRGLVFLAYHPIQPRKAKLSKQQSTIRKCEKWQQRLWYQLFVDNSNGDSNTIGVDFDSYGHGNGQGNDQGRLTGTATAMTTTWLQWM
jgi:hypothetical protein